MKIARKVPTVKVKSRHDSTCKFRGKPEKLSCNCPKQLRWSKDGKEHRESAETCDGAVAESKARKKMEEFERLSLLSPEEQAAEASKTIREVAELFIAKTKTENQNVTEKHLAKIRGTFEALAAYCEEEGVVAMKDVTLEMLEAFGVRGSIRLRPLEKIKAAS
jgi:hypothetical protein